MLQALKEGQGGQCGQSKGESKRMKLWRKEHREWRASLTSSLQTGHRYWRYLNTLHGMNRHTQLKQNQFLDPSFAVGLPEGTPFLIHLSFDRHSPLSICP